MNVEPNESLHWVTAKEVEAEKAAVETAGTLQALAGLAPSAFPDTPGGPSIAKLKLMERLQPLLHHPGLVPFIPSVAIDFALIAYKFRMRV